MSSRFERVSARQELDAGFFTIWSGTFRHEDGKAVERQWVEHDGAVGIVAHDGESLYLVRQPREAIGSPDLLELPAGKLDVEGEGPLETAKRELAEEIGKAAESASSSSCTRWPTWTR
jgi:8-oxo-dGTP pyrophosphatase MutT (NUDIX family)